MTKPSKIQARINEARKAKRIEKNEDTTPIWDKFHSTYMQCCEGKSKILTATMGAVSDMLTANEMQPLLTAFDQFELQGAMKLLDADYEFYTEQLEGIYQLHAKKRGGFSQENEDKTRGEIELGLEVGSRYTDLQRFFDHLIKMDNNIVFSILYRYEVRQNDLNKLVHQAEQEISQPA